MAHSIRGQTCGWQVKLYDPSLTRANLSALEMSIAHSIKRYTNVAYFTYYYFTTTPTVFSTMMRGKLREMFVIVTSLSSKDSDDMDVFLKQLIQFYSN